MRPNPDTLMQHPSAGPTLSPAMFYILLSLADGPKHGYGIMREVEQRHGAILGPGTLYGAVKRMLQTGLIAEAEERPDPDLDDQRRRYYRLTPTGRQSGTAEAQRLEGLVRQARVKRLLPEPRARRSGP